MSSNQSDDEIASINVSEDQDNMDERANSGPPIMNLTDINADSLFSITRRLEFQEQLNLSRVCNHLHNVHQMYSCWLYRKFDLKELKYMPKHDIIEFFKWHGHSIQRISGKYGRGLDRQLILELIKNHCMNLTYISFDSWRLHFYNRRGSYIKTRGFITNKTAKLIGCMTELKSLRCSLNDELTDECLVELENLKNLEEVDVRRCESITNVGLLRLLRRCPQLKHVNIQSCRVTNTFVLEAIETLNNCNENENEKENEKRKEPLLLSVANTRITKSVLTDSKYLDASSVLKLRFDWI